MQKPLHEKRTLLLTALCAAGMLLVLYVLLGIYPFGNNTVITGDFNGQYLNYFAHFRAAAQSGAGFAYGLDKSMGGSMLGILAYYCASLLNVLYLLVNPLYYDILAAVLLAVKAVLACVLMAFFLGRRFLALQHRALPVALCYGFCAYMFVYAQNIMWHDVLMLLPLICYGIYKVCCTARPFVFAVSLGAAIFANFYIGYMACIFSVLYFGYEMLLAAPNTGTKRFWLTRCGAFGGGALCAGGLSAVLLLPALADISTSKGLAKAFTLTGGTEFSLLRFFERLMPGSFAWKDVEAGLPNVYCGTLAVVLVILYFCAKGISRKEKLLSGGMLLVLFASLYFTDVMIAWHAFVPPVWFPYRHSFVFSFWLVYLAGAALCRARFARGTWLAAGCGGIAFLLLCYPTRAAMFTPKRFLLAAALCAMLAGLVYMLQYAQKRLVRGVCMAACALLCMAELCVNTYWTLPQFEQYPHSEYTQFVQDGKAMVGAVRAKDDTAYRMEKTYFRSLNDSMLLGYNGITHFGSTQDNNATDWIYHLGYRNSTASLYGSGSTVFADSLLGIKYLLARDTDKVAEGYIATDIAAADGYVIYQNPYALPLAFFVPQAAANTVLQPADDNGIAAQNDIFTLLSGQTQPLIAADGTLDTQRLAAYAAQQQKDAALVTLGISRLDAEVIAQKDGLLLITVPYDENLVLTVDGKKAEITKVFGTQVGVQLAAGTHTLHLAYKTPHLALGLCITLGSMAALAAAWLLGKKKEKQLCQY